MEEGRTSCHRYTDIHNRTSLRKTQEANGKTKSVFVHLRLDKARAGSTACAPRSDKARQLRVCTEHPLRSNQVRSLAPFSELRSELLADSVFGRGTPLHRILQAGKLGWKWKRKNALPVDYCTSRFTVFAGELTYLQPQPSSSTDCPSQSSALPWHCPIVSGSSSRSRLKQKKSYSTQ